MPIMSIVPLDFEEPHIRFLPLKIWAYMLFPSATAEWDRFLSSALLELSAGVAKSLNVGVEISPSALGLLQKKGDVLTMAEAAMQPVISGAAKSPNSVERSAGELAGELLLMAIAHDLENPGSVSLNGVLAFASDYFRRSKKTRPKDLKRVWHEYRPCAHLWAALLQWKELNGGAQLIPSDGIMLHSFLGLAEVLRFKGEAIRHKQAREALLPDGVAWRLPGGLIAAQAASKLGAKFL